MKSYKNSTDYFMDLLPMAIQYGMSIQQFWEDDPMLFWAYRFSYYLKKKEEQVQFNSQAWLQGAYFYEAVSVALSNGFSKNSQLKYSQKPYDLEPKKKMSKEEIIQMQVADIKARIKQVNKIKSGTTKEKGGEKNE